MAGAVVIRGARVHNLKNINLEIPRDRLVVITGVSGSGKSSLAFDTLYAEGQRRYLESLTAEAKSLVQQMERPDVDSIEGLSPAIAIQQKPAIATPRSTVGTVTEIYDYIRLLFAKVGDAHCIQCGRRVMQQSVQQIVDQLCGLPVQTRLVVLAPLAAGDPAGAPEQLRQWARQGFTRAHIDGEPCDLAEEISYQNKAARRIEIVIDRLVVRDDVERRLADSLEVAARVGDGVIKVEVLPDDPQTPLREMTFSQKLICVPCGISLYELTPQHFSFNSPEGACGACDGLGWISPARGPAQAATKDTKKTPCELCGGARLKKESLAVTVSGKNIVGVASLSVAELLTFFKDLKLRESARIIAQKVLSEITARLEFLARVGLDYLSLDRPSMTLSSGEAQRVCLATQLGSSLAGVLYILDEPSVGLHQQDNTQLLTLLRELRDRGNSVIVVEHDPETILSSDQVIDMGPGAGVHGGEVVAQGTPQELARNERSITGQYLCGKIAISIPRERRRSSRGVLTITGARQNNLKNMTARFPVGAMTCVTGVSGAGKSSLVIDTLYHAMAERLHRSHRNRGAFDELIGWEHFDRVVGVDQTPIGRTPRSNPATYSGLFDPLRDLFAQLPDARVRGYGANRFTFNVPGGRCESCAGDGVRKINMYFLPEVFVTCDLCKGKRYNRETLEIKYKGLSIADVLGLTINQAIELLRHIPPIYDRLRTLNEVGLGYLRLGQAASTLSGGEAQRVKLARELGRRSTGRSLYILDEPTTGLHFADVGKLLELLNRLIDAGNTVVVIEHNLDVIKSADHIIDLGPGGGPKGGWVIVQGTPEQVSQVVESATGRYLKALFGKTH
jgi:excinuclease ABC subunit A